MHVQTNAISWQMSSFHWLHWTSTFDGVENAQAKRIATNCQHTSCFSLVCPKMLYPQVTTDFPMKNRYYWMVGRHHYSWMTTPCAFWFVLCENLCIFTHGQEFGAQNMWVMAHGNVLIGIATGQFCRHPKKAQTGLCHFSMVSWQGVPNDNLIKIIENITIFSCCG